jgi:hypothetical protein
LRRQYRGDIGPILPDWEATVDEPQQPAEDLLAEAVDALDPGDRRRVLAWLLGRLAAGPAPHAPMDVWTSQLLQARSRGHGMLLAQATPRGPQQVVPVRLPSEQHAQLRDWCQANGFSMATVIRGLVGRFLDERGENSGPAPAP